MLFPTASIVVPYESEPDCSPFETGIARYAHGILTSGYADDLIEAAEHAEGKTLLLLKVPVILWNLDTNQSTLFRAVVLVEENEEGRQDAWTSNDQQLLLRAFRA